MMYLTIQKKINICMLILFVISLTLMLFLYPLLKTSKLLIIITYFVIFMIDFIILRFLEKNWEYHKIYQMLQAGDIALATIKKATFYKKVRETDFAQKNIYALDVSLLTKGFQKSEVIIYEYMHDDDFSSLPGDVYVTYDAQKQMIGIIPTVLLSMTPSVEPIVRKFEEGEQIHYIGAAKKNGLVFKKMADIVKGSK